jgi:hypothetical protein
MTLQPTLTSWHQRNLESPEHIYAGITRKWLHNGAVLYYAVSTVSRPAIDAWLDSVVEVLKIWPVDQPYLAIHDATHSALTPYARSRIAEVSRNAPLHIRGRSAAVMSRSLFAQAARMFMTLELARQNKRIGRNLFFDVDSALAWVLAHQSRHVEVA